MNLIKRIYHTCKYSFLSWYHMNRVIRNVKHDMQVAKAHHKLAALYHERLNSLNFNQ